LIACLIFLSINLILDKTLIQIFQMSRDLSIVRNRIKDIEQKNQKLKLRIQQASDPNFIESEVRDKLDFTNEGDLIFIFPDHI